MRIHWLWACAALAAGEGTGLLTARGACCWPLTAVLAVLITLLGYGLSWRGWHLLVLFFIGLTLFFHASLTEEQRLRDAPWLRNTPRRNQIQEKQTSPIRGDLSRRASIGLAHNTMAANLNRAILLGERQRLPRRVKQIFVESGTLHVFAISGLHVMLVARVLVLTMSLLFVPVRFAGLVALLPLWGYVFLTGASPSAIRAGAMATLHFLAPLFWRRPNALHAWSLTFLGVHLTEPKMIGNVGCLLSFSVMLAILSAVEISRNWQGEWKKSICIALSAWLAGVPIAAHIFGRITPGALLANIPLIPAAGGTVISGIFGLATSYLYEPFAAHLNNLAALFTDAMVGISTGIASLPGMNYETSAWPLWTCLLWYVALALAFWLLARRTSRTL